MFVCLFFYPSSSGSLRWGTSAGRFQSSWLAVRLTSERIKSALESSRPWTRTPLHTRRYDGMCEHWNNGQLARKQANQKLKPQAVQSIVFTGAASLFLWLQGEQTRQQMNADMYLECSAKYQENVEDIFREATKKALAFVRKQRNYKRKQKCLILWVSTRPYSWDLTLRRGLMPKRKLCFQCWLGSCRTFNHRVNFFFFFFLFNVSLRSRRDILQERIAIFLSSADILKKQNKRWVKA